MLPNFFNRIQKQERWFTNSEYLHRGSEAVEEMLTCFLCPSTKRVTREITKQLKSLSLKAKESKWLPDKNIKKIDAKESEERKAIELATREEKEEEQEEEWVAEPEPGVLITLVPLGDEGNYIKKIRFSVERFDAMEAQKWWSENYDRIMELYCICLPSSPYQSDEDELDSGEVQIASTSQSSNEQSNAICEDQEHPKDIEESSRAESTKGIKGKVVKWVIEDEPGVFVTISSLPDDTKEIVRVELCRERFGEVNAKLWWEENKTRLQEQYV